MAYLTKEFFATCVLALDGAFHSGEEDDFFYFISFIHTSLKNHSKYLEEVFGREGLKTHMFSAAKLFLKDRFYDTVNDYNHNPVGDRLMSGDDFDKWIWDEWINEDNKDAYNGNDTYDNYVLTLNKLRDILKKLKTPSISNHDF